MLALALAFGSGEPQESSAGISRLSVICLRLRGDPKGLEGDWAGCPGRARVIVPLICVN